MTPTYRTPIKHPNSLKQRHVCFDGHALESNRFANLDYNASFCFDNALLAFTDASRYPQHHHAGIGGAFFYQSVQPIATFGTHTISPYHPNSCIPIEYDGLICAATLAPKQALIHTDTPIVFFTDAQQVVMDLMFYQKRTNQSPWDSYRNRFFDALEGLSNWRVQWIRRGANHHAHVLAQKAAHAEDPFFQIHPQAAFFTLPQP